MFHKAIKKTTNNNIEIILLWFALLIAKVIIWPKTVILSLTIFLLIIAIIAIKYVELQPKSMWILPTLIIIFLQIITIIDLIKHYYIGNVLLCICLVVFRDWVFKDATVIFFNLISVASYYIEQNNVFTLVIPTINLLFVIVTIIIKRQNIWLEVAKNYHLELITYISKILPDLCNTVMTNLFQPQTYLSLYNQFKIQMSEPSNLPKHIESLQKMETTLLNAADLSKSIVPPDRILLYMLPLACVPTIFAFFVTYEWIFLGLAIFDLLKLIYYHKCSKSQQELVYGSLFLQTINTINSGIDLGIKAVKITKQSLDTYLVSIEYVTGVITNITNNVTYVQNKIKEKVTAAQDVATSYVKPHPYLATAVLGLGVIGCMALMKRQ